MAHRENLPRDLLIKHHPVAVFADRYGGVYSSGPWLAVSSADGLCNGEMRASWVLRQGPFGEDSEARAFWADPPYWIASGDTPEEAISKLELRQSKA